MKEKCIFDKNFKLVFTGWIYLVRYKNIDGLLKDKKIALTIDFKPALTEEKLDSRILRDFEELKNKQFKNSLDKLLPKKLIPVIIQRTGINENKKVNEITKEERRKIIKELKSFKIYCNQEKRFVKIGYSLN